ncbi:MAG: hypothetical protein ACP5E9_10650 [Candidatus Methanospirareceae archaeon]
MMEVEEKNLIRAILEEVKTLKGRVEVLERMLETLVETYTDAFYEVKDEYLAKLEELRKDKGAVFNSIEEFDGYFE